MAKKNVLGRGLGALIADAAEEPVTREIVVSAIQERLSYRPYKS